MNCWKVVGFEAWKNDKGADCVRLYVARVLSLQEGHSGDGLETQRLYYRPEYLKEPYEPTIGHLIVATEGRYGIDQIFVVGTDNGK